MLEHCMYCITKGHNYFMYKRSIEWELRKTMGGHKCNVDNKSVVLRPCPLTTKAKRGQMMHGRPALLTCQYDG